MTVCPIAIAVGCKKCPAFAVCPLKTILGDHTKAGAAPGSNGTPEATEATGTGQRPEK